MIIRSSLKGEKKGNLLYQKELFLSAIKFLHSYKNRQSPRKRVLKIVSNAFKNLEYSKGGFLK